MEELLKRFTEQAPVAVMARLGLQRAIGAEWVDQVFEERSKTQYTRELLFSTVVELMSLVALGMRPSLHAAAQKRKERLPVSLTALYDKVHRVEPEVVRALVSGSAVRLAPVMARLRQGAAPMLPRCQATRSSSTTRTWIRKHPRGPKPKVARGSAPRASVQRHVSTAKVLRDGRVR